MTLFETVRDLTNLRDGLSDFYQREAIDTAIDALSKQVAVTPSASENGECCPVCRTPLNNTNYCSNCGQKIMRRD